MPKVIIFILLNVFLTAYLTGTALGQNKNDDSTSIKITTGKNILFDIDNENYEYLASDIEHSLLGLNLGGDQNTKLFHTVVGLNFLLNGYTESEKIIIKGEFYDKKDHSDEKVQPSKPSLAIYNSVLEQIKDVQYFLLVKINSLNNGSLGVELTLYQTFDSGTFDYKKLNPLKHRALSFHINLNNEDYKVILKMNIHQLFYEANSLLAPYIQYDNVIIKDSVYVSTGSIELQGNAGAPDLSPNGLKLYWDVDCEECPNSIKSGFAQSVNFFAEESHKYYVTLTATDDRDTVSTTCIIIPMKRPLIDLYLQLGADFSKSTIKLYTYQKQFVPNDYSHIFNVHLPISKRTTIDAEGNWVILANNIQVVSSLPNIKFSLAHFDTNKIRLPIDEIQIPIIGKSDFIQPQQDPSIRFIFRTDSTRSYGDSLFYNKFTLFSRSETAMNIGTPSTIHFILGTYNNSNAGDYNFDIEFRRKSRISPFFNYSGLRLKGDNGTSINLVGLGVDYFIIRGLSVEGSLGSATTRSFSSPVQAYYKLDADLNLLSFENALRLSFDFSDLYRETYNFPAPSSNEPITPAGYRLRFGFGGLLKLFISDAKYCPFSLDCFYNFYPNGYELYNFSEFGLRASVYFAK